MQSLGRALRITRFMRNTKLVTILVCAIVVSVVLFKLASEPYIFDPTYGVRSVYGFVISDPKEPFTVFYIAKGTDFAVVDGNFHIENQTLQIRSSTNSSAEWVFDTQPFLSILECCGGSLTESSILVTTSNPVSSTSDTNVLVYANNYLAVNESLTTISEKTYTWNVTTQWDIPGSNFGYPYVFAVFSIPPESLFSEPTDQRAQIRLETSSGVEWEIGYVVLKLSSDPHTLRHPWWQQNMLLLASMYVSAVLIAPTALILLFESKRRSLRLSVVGAVKGWIFRNNALLLYVGTGLLLRFILMVAFPLGSGDQFTYRFISLLSYDYGVDTRSFYSMYGTVWHGLLIITYPLYLFLRPLAPFVSSEYIILKVPIVACDILIALFLYRIGEKLAGSEKAKTLLLFWLFNPFILWLSSVWGTHHIVPTMFTVLAVERIMYGHHKEGGIALSAAVFSGPNNVFLLPVFLILIYKALGKTKLVDFATFFLLGSSVFALPWTFSISIFFNTYAGAGRVGFPTLSYSYFLVPGEIAGIWSLLSYLVCLGLLCALIARERQPNLSRVTDHILIAFFIFYLTNTLVFPTYALWSLPYLLFVCVCERKLPFSYLAAFMGFPVLWIMYWTPPLLPQFLQAPGTGIFRETFGLNFSFVCVLILMNLGFVRSSPREDLSKRHPLRSAYFIMTSLVILALLLVVFAPWIKEPLWLELWDRTLKPLFVVISVLAIAGILLTPRRSVQEEMATRSPSGYKDGYAAVAAIAVVWLYNILGLISSQVFPLVFSLSPIVLSSSDDLYFSLIMLLWLPLISYRILRNRESLFLVPWILLIQIDYMVTRHYSTYIVIQRILNVYLVTHTPTLVADLLAVSLMLLFLFLMLFYKSREPQTQ